MFAGNVYQTNNDLTHVGSRTELSELSTWKMILHSAAYGTA